MLKELLVNLIKPIKLPIREYPLQQLEKDLKAGKSFIRWGDGEVALMKGVNISYQNASPDLAYLLKNVLLGCNDSIVIASPYRYVCMSIFQLLVLGKLRTWLRSRAFYIRHFNKSELMLADAFGFRSESGFSYLQVLNRVCEGRKVTLLSSNQSDREFLMDLTGVSSVDLIVVNNRNSFDDLSKIIGGIKKFENEIVISSAGPVSKVLPLFIITEGFQVIDVGHLFSQYRC